MWGYTPIFYIKKVFLEYPIADAFEPLFLLDPGVPGVRSMGPLLSHKLSYLVQT